MTKIGIVLLVFIPLLCGAQVSNNMTLAAQWNPNDIPSAGSVKYNDIWGYVDDTGREYALVGSAQSIHILDVTDANNPIEVDRVPGGQSTIWRDIKTYKNRIYAVSDNTSEGLIIMDASYLPDSVHVTYQSTEFFAQAHNIFIDEPHDRIYVAGANTRSNGLITLDISTDMDNPQLLSSLDLPGLYVHDLYVNDHFVYASHGWNGLYIYDYSDVNAPTRLADIPTFGYNHSSWMTDDCRYLVYAEEVPTGIDMGVIDLADLLIGEIEIAKLFKFPLLAPTHTNVTPHNPYIRDTILVVSYYLDGTQVFDIGDAADPQPYAHYDTKVNSNYNVGGGNWGTYPYLPSGNIISSDIENGLFVMSMDDYDMATVDYTPSFDNPIIELEEALDICNGEPLELRANSNYNHYFWYKDGAQMDNEIGSSLIADETGVYQAFGLQGQKMIASNTFDFTRVEKPTVALDNGHINALSTTSGSFEWLANGVSIGQTGTSIEPTFSAYYQVERTDDQGCVKSSDSLYYFIPQELNVNSISGWNVQYQMDDRTIAVTLESSAPTDIELSIINVLGQTMTQRSINVNGFLNESIVNEDWGTGIYFVSIREGKNLDTFKIYIPSE